MSISYLCLSILYETTSFVIYYPLNSRVIFALPKINPKLQFGHFWIVHVYILYYKEILGRTITILRLYFKDFFAFPQMDASIYNIYDFYSTNFHELFLFCNTKIKMENAVFNLSMTRMLPLQNHLITPRR